MFNYLFLNVFIVRTCHLTITFESLHRHLGDSVGDSAIVHNSGDSDRQEFLFFKQLAQYARAIQGHFEREVGRFGQSPSRGFIGYFAASRATAYLNTMSRKVTMPSRFRSPSMTTAREILNRVTMLIA